MSASPAAPQVAANLDLLLQQRSGEAAAAFLHPGNLLQQRSGEFAGRDGQCCC